MKKGIILGVIAILLGGSSTALAATVERDGGTWSYGVGKKYVYSDYYHKHRTHKSTAIGRTSSTSGWVRKGTTSKASAEKRSSGNQAYYDIK